MEVPYFTGLGKARFSIIFLSSYLSGWDGTGFDRSDLRFDVPRTVRTLLRTRRYVIFGGIWETWEGNCLAGQVRSQLHLLSISSLDAQLHLKSQPAPPGHLFVFADTSDHEPARECRRISPVRRRSASKGPDLAFAPSTSPSCSYLLLQYSASSPTKVLDTFMAHNSELPSDGR